ncbi:hypothetical protein, partial [Shewanella sp. 10N.286.52.E4]|uniref:hypothetical protein n=1 Tax=Shewanella sp. 10N.286.52.E4 TaxID=3229715 RepID=UPI00354F9F91
RSATTLTLIQTKFGNQESTTTLIFQNSKQIWGRNERLLPRFDQHKVPETINNRHSEYTVTVKLTVVN